MFKASVAAIAVLIGSVGLVAPVQAGGGGGGNSGGGGGGQRTETRLEARMRAGSTESKVAFRGRTEGNRVQNHLEAEVRRGTPNTNYAVTVNGVQVGTIRTNSLGNGQIEFERNVPTLAAGTAVSVGAMTGTLQVVR